MRIRLIALSLLAGIIVPASSALAAGPGGIGIRLVDVPAHSLDDPLARSYIVGQVVPGTTSRRRIEISNSTSSTAAVAIYPAGAGLDHGTFGFAPGHSPNELSSWTSVSRDVVRLAPGTKGFHTVTINVPKDASFGERYAVIWAEVSTPARPGGGVRLVNRVGVRMYVSVGPGGALAANFAIGSITAERSQIGEPSVVAIVHNTGGQRLDISGDLTLTEGPGRLRAGPFPVTLESQLAPGTPASAAVRLDKRMPRGPWRVHIRLRSGSLQRTAVTTITFPALVGAANPPPASVAESRPLIVVAVILFLVLLAILALALLLPRVPRGRDGIGPATTA